MFVRPFALAQLAQPPKVRLYRDDVGNDVQRAMHRKWHESAAKVLGLSTIEPQIPDYIGNLIADVMEKVGKDGVITVDESRGIDFETEFVEGMQFDRGFISPYFITNADSMEAIIEDPYILIYEKKLSNAQDIIPVLEKLVQTGKREIVIICENVDGQALATLVLNKLRGMLNVLAV
ncbi:MAG: chaperonin GroEL, partial [Alkalinema sp. RL_2_19]|nr:chaperonin GroEL [Alkalinema sp. RL_2_19]